MMNLFYAIALSSAVALLSSNGVTAYKNNGGVASQRSLCELSECTTVCPSNLTDFQESMYSPSCGGEVVTTLKLLTSDQGLWAAKVAERFSKERPDVNVEIVELDGNSVLFENIINEAKSKTGLCDIFNWWGFLCSSLSRVILLPVFS